VHIWNSRKCCDLKNREISMFLYSIKRKNSKERLKILLNEEEKGNLNHF